MSGSELYVNIGRVYVHHDPPSPPIDRFTWQSDPLERPVDLAALKVLVAQMEEDLVPGDASLQFSGPRVYAHWHRHVR